ncbi:MAG: outer membrane protein assembly factor BamE [Rickettsiales bacterium]|nr:outer membrane protein assembly factor BamE [Rickettsiales bacterium]
MRLFLASIFLLIAATSCVSRVDKHGFMFEFSDHEMLQEGVTTKERVLKMMGSPTLVSDLDQDETWIYFSEDLKRFLFFKPKIVERNILVIRFKSDTVRELKKLNLNNEENNLQFTADYTAVDSHKVGFFKSIFSNVGQIKPQ